MIISKTPYRITFFGGGTDYPSWYKFHGGQVINATIDKYIYITCRYLPPFFDHTIRLSYSKQEAISDLKKISHPSFREALKFYNINKNIEIHYDGDLPSKSGIGSSSAFTVGLINALSHFRNIKISKKKLATNALHIEQKMIKENVGSQDQIAAAYGGINHIKFLKNLDYKVAKIKMTNKTLMSLNSKLMLFHTGVFRKADLVSKKYINKLDSKSKYLNEMSSMVKDAKNLLKTNKLDDFGKLLNESWNLKKSISSNISNSFIDSIYDTAIKSGAIGGKLLGAGSGGFMMFYVPLKHQAKTKIALKKLLNIPFNFENYGSHIIYNSNTKNE